jgi:hypothetical protein
LPDQSGQFEFWSCFLACEALESFFRYVHDLIHDAYLQILERHTEWEQQMEKEGCPEQHDIPTRRSGIPEIIRYWHPRLILDDDQFLLTTENAEEFFAFAMDMLRHFKGQLDDEAKDALENAAYEAYQLGNGSK